MYFDWNKNVNLIFKDSLTCTRICFTPGSLIKEFITNWGPNRKLLTPKFVACWGLWAKYCDNVYCKYTRQSGANGIQSLDSPKSTSTGRSLKSTLHPKRDQTRRIHELCIWFTYKMSSVPPGTNYKVIISTKNKEITHKSDLLMYWK